MVAEKKKSFCISTKFLKINNKNCVEAVFVGHLGIREQSPTWKTWYPRCNSLYTLCTCIRGVGQVFSTSPRISREVVLEVNSAPKPERTRLVLNENWCKVRKILRYIQRKQPSVLIYRRLRKCAEINRDSSAEENRSK